MDNATTTGKPRKKSAFFSSLAVYKREMLSYFTSPIGYSFVAIFFAVSGFVFTNSTVQASDKSSTTNYFTIMLYLFIVTVPLITMKLVSEERKMKTEQLLLTAPISLFGIVAGKFFAAFTMIGGSLLVSSLIYYIPLTVFGTPNPATYFGSVFAIILVGSAFTAIGLFISSLTENQFISAYGTMGTIIIFLLLGRLNSYINVAFIRVLIDSVSVLSRFSNFTYGIFDFAALVYYISITAAFLFLTVRSFEKRRWS